MSGFFRLTSRKQKKLQKLFSSVAVFSLFLQITSGVFYYQPVIAEDGTETTPAVEQPVETPTVSETTPAPENTPSPESTPSVETPVELTPTPVVELTPTPTPIEGDVAGETISQPQETGPPLDLTKPVEDPVSAQIVPTPTPVEKVCLAEGQEIKDTTNDNWEINLGEDWSQTKESVKLGVKYVFPQENKVSVTFNCLPKDGTTNLKIQKVKISDLKLPEGTNPYGEWAYDITTGMQDGTFEYDVTLPKPEGQTAEVSFMEEKNGELKAVDEGKLNQEGDKVKAESLDHFTIFFTTASDYSTDKSIYKQGETVYVKAGDLNTSKYYKIAINPPGWNNTFDITSCFRPSSGNTALTGFYDLPTSATISTDWKAELKRWDSSSSCSGGSFGDATDSFEVIAGDKPELTATKTNDVSGNATINQAFTWTIRLQNSGDTAAIFNNSNEILKDERPSDGVSSYGSIISTAGNGATGAINCSQSGTVNRDLTCTANGTVVIPVNGYFDISYSVTPNATGSLVNPRSGKVCKVDRNNSITEKDDNNNTCSNTVTVAAVQPVTNPTLGQSCGLDIALVFDGSGSIDDVEYAQMQAAFVSFVNAFLPGTPTEMSIVEFASSSTIRESFTNNKTNLINEINASRVQPGGMFTNWEQGLISANSLFANRSNPDLIVFASDGNPNRIGNPASEVDEDEAVASAVGVANIIKGNGIRIITIGIGDDLDSSNLIDISSADAYYGSNFDQLAATLAQLATSLCGGTISVNKYIDTVSDQTRGDNNWMFNVSGPNGYSNDLGTNASGQAITDTLVAGSGYSVIEKEDLNPAGYAFGSVACYKSGSPSPIGNSFTDVDGNHGVNNITVGNNDIIYCDFVNTTLPRCGDGHVDSGEECEGTSSTSCVVGDYQGNKTCNPTTCLWNTCTPTEFCGDGQVNGSEQCDDGNSVNHDSCSTSCKTEYPITFEKEVTGGDAQPSEWSFNVSGYGTVYSGDTVYFIPGYYPITETGPDHYSLGSTSGSCHDSSGNIELAVSDSDPDFCRITNVYEPYCGDGVKNGTEQCDGDDLGGLPSSDFSCNECQLELIQPKVTICHRTSSHTNPYNVQEPNKSADVSGHDGHNGPIWYPGINVEWGDIIPPFYYIGGYYTGKNWTTEGEAIYNNGCTFPSGTITFVKNAQPDGSQVFNFTYGFNEYPIGNFSLTDDGGDGSERVTFSAIPSGVYSWSEDIVLGWSLDNIQCTEDKTTNSTTDLSNRSVNIVLDPGENVTCAFTNTKKGTISGMKYEDYDGDINTPGQYGVADWTIQLWQDDVLKSSTTTSSSWGNYGFYSFTDLEPGDYIVKEVLTSGWYALSSESISVTLDPGENDSGNNFFNAQYATVTVYKEVDTDGDGDIDIANSPDWTWNIGDINDLQTGTTASDIPAGYRTISENQETGYHVTSFKCNNGVVDWTYYGAVESQSVELVSGQNLECVFTNARDIGQVTFQKVVDQGPGQPSDWHFGVYDGNGGLVGDTFTSGNTYPIAVGDYRVEESSVEGYSFDNVSGICSVNPANGQIVMNVTADGGTCTIINTRDVGSVKVNKKTDNDGNGSFEMGNTGSNALGFRWIIDGGIGQTFGTTVNNLPTTLSNYSHSFEEYIPAGYHFVGWYNTDEAGRSCSSLNGTNIPSTIQANKNQTTKITLCNARDTGTIKIIKDAIDNSDENFSFDTNSNFPDGDFELEDDGHPGNGGTPEQRTFTAPVGSYWVDERDETGWKLTNLVCSGDDNIVVNQATGKVEIDLDKGENVVCIYTNTELAKVSGYKFNDKNASGNWEWWNLSLGEYALGNWRIFIDEADGNGLYDGTEPSYVTNDWIWYVPFWTGYYEFNNLLPGTYSICEELQSNWTNITPLCRTIELSPGEHESSVNFGNIQYGSVIGHKFEDDNMSGQQDAEEDNLSGWTIGVYDGSDCQGMVISNGFQITDGDGNATFPNLAPGSYSVKEELDSESGWQTTTPVCQNITVSGGQPTTVNIGNFELGDLYVDKYEDKDGILGRNADFEPFISNPTFTFRVYEATAGGWLLKGQEDTDSIEGRATFTDVFDSVGNYFVCEVKKAGWEDMRSLHNPANNQSGAENEYSTCEGITVSMSGYGVYAEFGNIRLGKVTVCKYDDYDGDGQKDENEPGINGVNISINHLLEEVGDRQFTLLNGWSDQGITGDGDNPQGCYTFSDLLLGDYRVVEDTTSPVLAGYEASDGTETAYDVSLTEGGQTQYVNFFNELQPITLGLTKTHNKVGFTVVRGETLTFTLTVENTADSTAYNVNVRDVLPLGFSYVPGTARVDGNLSEPTLSGQQLTWNVGNMDPDQKIVVTYDVKVSDSQNEGGYPNVAVAFGTNRPTDSDDISTSYSNFAYVYTAVGIGLSYAASIGGGFVLGAATGPIGSVLGAATGSPTMVLIMAILMILAGLAILLKKGKKFHV